MKRIFGSTLNYGKLTGINVLRAKGIILKKLFHFLLISVLIYIVSVSIIFQHTLYLHDYFICSYFYYLHVQFSLIIDFQQAFLVVKLYIICNVN